MCVRVQPDPPRISEKWRLRNFSHASFNIFIVPRNISGVWEGTYGRHDRRAFETALAWPESERALDDSSKQTSASEERTLARGVPLTTASSSSTRMILVGLQLTATPARYFDPIHCPSHVLPYSTDVPLSFASFRIIEKPSHSFHLFHCIIILTLALHPHCSYYFYLTAPLPVLSTKYKRQSVDRSYY